MKDYPDMHGFDDSHDYFIFKKTTFLQRFNGKMAFNQLIDD